MADTTISLARKGVTLEVFTIVWMVAEAALSIAAGIMAGSALIAAFGIDSLIELVSGGILLWRLQVESRGGDDEAVERAEQIAARIVAGMLVLLCLYVLGSSAYGLIAQSKPESSPLGIGVSALAVVVMPALAYQKRKVADQIGSQALRGDAVESITCATMAATVLAGLGLNALLGWWWAESAAGLVFLVWLARETKEAIEEARGKADDD